MPHYYLSLHTIKAGGNMLDEENRAVINGANDAFLRPLFAHARRRLVSGDYFSVDTADCRLMSLHALPALAAPRTDRA